MLVVPVVLGFSLQFFKLLHSLVVMFQSCEGIFAQHTPMGELNQAWSRYSYWPQR